MTPHAARVSGAALFFGTLALSVTTFAATPAPREPLSWRLLPPDDIENLRAAVEGGLDPHHPLVEALERHGRFDPVEPPPADPFRPLSIPFDAQSTSSLAQDALVNLRLWTCLRCNNLPAAQVEPSVAVHGNHVVVAVNNYGGTCNLTTREDYAYSSDGGVTYTDALGFPPTEQNGQMFGDPAVAVNRKTGVFYISALNGGGTGGNGTAFTGVACAKAHFSGSSFVLDRLTRTVTNPYSTGHFYDRPFMTVDSLSGNVYFTWADFGTINNAIMFQAFDADLNPLSPMVTLAPEDTACGYQDAQPAVGPNGEVYVVWWQTTLFRDSIAIRKSLDHGATFGPRQLVSARFHSDSWNGPPGMQRGFGMVVPSIAVDNTNGPHRGRIYVSWEGALDYFAPTGTQAPRVEVERNDVLSRATPFVPGSILRGRLELYDRDIWKFTGLAGQTFVALASWDSTGAQTTVTLHHASNPADTTTDVVLSSTGLPDNGIIFSLPSDGTYYMQFDLDHTVTAPVTYVVGTALIVPGPNDIARDVRDPLFSWSDDFQNWSTPIRLNDNAPGYDSVYPSLAVDGQGRLYCAWLDYRDDAFFGIKCRTVMASSGNGGVTWGANRALADAGSYWPMAMCINNGNSIGDYMQMSADGDRVLAAFTDARFGDSDILADASVHSQSLTCPGDITIVASPDTTIQFDLFNGGNYTRGFNWSLTDTRGWISAVVPAASGAQSLDPGQHLAVTATVFPSNCTGDSTIATFAVTDPYIPGSVQSCVSVVRCAGGITPTLVSLLGTEVSSDRVMLIWTGSDHGAAATVYRHGTSDDWAPLGHAAFDGSGQLRFEDRTVAPGARYAYRLGWVVSGAEQFSPATWVSVPAAFSLSFAPPRPNPSPGSARLSYVLSHAGPVRLDLFTATGARVRTLESGMRDAGPHEVAWNGTDERGRSMPSGVYFARLDAEGRAMRHLVMVLR